MRMGNNGELPGERKVEKCLNCQFYDRRNARPTDGRAAMWGQCRRHSAHLNPLSAKSYLVEGVWPLVRDDDWCGEWKAPTLASMSRATSVPRTDELVKPAAAAASAAASDNKGPVLVAVSAAAAAGDD
jgi:hypothetical protein